MFIELSIPNELNPLFILATQSVTRYTNCKIFCIQVLSNACLALAQLVSNFGVKKVKIAEYAEIMLKNAQNTNPDCKK